MKKITILCCLAIQFLNAQSYQKIHNDAILIDTHNDFLTKTMNYDYVFDTDLSGKTQSDFCLLYTSTCV